MADYNQHSGYMGQQEDRRKPAYNAQQDESGFKQGNDYPDTRKPNFGGGYEGQGYGDQGYQGYGDQTGETFQDAPERRKTGYGDTDSGVGGPKSGYGASQEGGAYDRATGEQSQFGLAGKTGSYGAQASDPQLGATDTSSYGAKDPLQSDFDKAPHGVESVPAGDGWGAEDTSPTHGAKKDGLVNKIKQKLPGQHHTADGGVTHSDPNAPPKKSIVEKIKEKLPGHHGSDDAAGM